MPPQLTLRAVLVGMLIGAVMCLSNIYVFFKTGWSLGVTLTACILAFAAFQALQAAGIVKRPLTVLENNALTTVSSGAGFMTGGGNMAAFGALLMVTSDRPPAIPMIAWFAVIAALGVFAAIPIKRQLIDVEQLAFPTGTATAETIRSLHDVSVGAAGGTSKARSLAYAGVVGAVIALFRDAKAAWMPFNLPSTIGRSHLLGIARGNLLQGSGVGWALRARLPAAGVHHVPSASGVPSRGSPRHFHRPRGPGRRAGAVLRCFRRQRGRGLPATQGHARGRQHRRGDCAGPRHADLPERRSGAA